MSTLTGRSMKFARNIIKPKLPSKNRENLLLNVSRTLSTPSATTSHVDYQPTIPITSLDLKLAGQLVDTPINHFEIRNLLREETILSAFAMEKVSSLQSGLSSTHHPIISVAQEIFQDSDTKWINSLGGFTLLLLAKSLESVPSFNLSHYDKKQSTTRENVWERQKFFAECYEMIDKAMYIHHQSIINIPVKSSSESIVIDEKISRINKILNNGNKLAVLGGDYLFSFGIIRLASLVKHVNVFDFIGASIDEFCVNQFDNYQKEISNYIKPESGMNMETWEKYGGYCSAKLAAYSAQFITILPNLSSIRFEQSAFNFGYNLKLKWNLEEDIQTTIDTSNRRLNPISAPLIKYIEKDPQFIDYLSKLDWEKDDAVKKVKQVLLKSNVIDECQSLSKLYSDKCIKLLQIFPDCPSRRVLESIAKGNVSV